jgi:hypothetical protein
MQKYIIVQVGFNKRTNLPTYQVAMLSPVGMVYKTSIGVTNDPTDLGSACNLRAKLEQSFG